MQTLFSDRILNTKSSFTREILKATENKNMISFAGGLPNPVSFPKDELSISCERIIKEHKDRAFQYATTEGYLPLREYIAGRYKKRFGLSFDAEDIIITTGSQQALDLIGKTFLNKGDSVIIEEPGYLGAIQAFSMYEPEFIPVMLEEDGVNLMELETALNKEVVKLFYSVPNFQNPTGLTYSGAKRQEVCKLIQKQQVVLIEDDPYGELSFEEESLPYIGAGNLEYSILLGSFSKTITPGMRLGFLCTKNKDIMQHIITAKQGTDLHTNIFAQMLIYDYLTHNDYEQHIAKIKTLYQEQCQAMLSAIALHFPSSVSHTKPKGGMFLWATLQADISTMDVLREAMKAGVLFVPGDPFYTKKEQTNTLRLNYTNTDPTTICDGISRLGRILHQYN